MKITLDFNDYYQYIQVMNKGKKRMTKIHKFQNNIAPTFVEKQGIVYKVVDMGGYKVEIRVKPEAEVKRDNLLFNSK